MDLKTIKDIKDIKGKKVLLRLDLNVPMEKGMIKDDFRILKSLKTLNYLKVEGAKIIIISHIGDDGRKSLNEIAKYLSVPIFDLKLDDSVKKKIDEMKEGGVVMLDNLRKDPGEKNNDENFAKSLASLADVFVNEAFSVSHRKHASIVSVPKFLPSYFGFLFEEEVLNLSKAFNPDHPFTFVLGGAKFETKLPIVKKFLNIADKVFIGGALANSLIKESGKEVGKSLVDKENLDLKELIKDPKIIFPKDVVAITGSCNCVKVTDEIAPEDQIVDTGHQFNDELDTAIFGSKFILWNGPLGLVEEGYDQGTKSLAKSIAITPDATTIIGGGDTLAVVKELNIFERFDFVSTGGGAMLDFLASGTLPGIEAIQNKHE